MPEPFQRQSILYGWTYQQWSWACGKYGILDFDTPAEVSAFRDKWDREQSLNPGPGLIHVPGAHHPTAPVAAYKAFLLVTN